MRPRRTETVNIHEAKTHLSRLIEEVTQGTSDVVISKAGKPLVRLVRLEPSKPVRKPGFLKGRIKIAGDFDEPLPRDLLDAFEGRK
jgi:prevent-host-death family protein